MTRRHKKFDALYGKLMKILKIPVIFVLLLSMAGCLESLNKHMARNDEENILARVGSAVLTRSDVDGMYAQEGAFAGDSSLLLEAYVNSWVMRQLKIQEAERLMKGSGEDIEAMVNDYRNSLLQRRLEQYYVEKYIDTLISEGQIFEYYNQHGSDFKLDREMVKGRIVRVPVSYRQQAKLKELMGAKQEERQKDFLDLCVKNKFTYTDFENWVDFREFISYIPTTRGKSYDYMLAERKVQELSDPEYKYYIQIRDNLQKGDRAPLEHVEQIIRRIIYNQRRSEIIRRSEDSLYMAAVNSGRAIVNNNLIKQN